MKFLPYKIVAIPSPETLAVTFGWLDGVNEGNRNPVGGWGIGYGVKDTPQHPLNRDAARTVIGYTQAFHATQDMRYWNSALYGLKHLLNEQQADGQWPWHYRGVQLGGPDSLYVTSLPPVALIEGWLMTYEHRYLDAAKKSADYLCTVPDSVNANYNCFAAWSLASVYSVDGEKKYLDKAVKFARRAILTQRTDGAWCDRKNQYVWYHAIILRGLAKLLSVMPETHKDYWTIKNATRLAMCHLRSRMQFDGSVRESLTTDKTSFNSNAYHAIATVAELGWDVDDCVALAMKGIVRRDQISPRYAAGKTMGLGALLNVIRKYEIQ